MAGRKVSRRDFLKGVSVAGGAALAGVPGVRLSARRRVLGPAPVPVRLRVNGRDHELTLEPRVTLLNALRDHLGLTGPKLACDRGACGACTVLLDDRPIVSCLMLAVDAPGRAITTVEGLAGTRTSAALLEAFVEADALQCGFCTPGMIMSCEALLRAVPAPAPEQIRRAFSGNLCRCGIYPLVFEACRRAAEARR